MNKNQFIKDLQQFESVSAVGVSALRGQGRGVIAKIRAYLGNMDLSVFRSIKSRDAFESWLNHQTNNIVSINHSPSIKWGAARKALNLFLRDCLYNKYLSREYKIENVEPFLEIPLDSIIAKELKKDAGRGCLPQWKGLKHLKIDESKFFQEYASQIAATKKISRVHLDVNLWVNNR